MLRLHICDVLGYLPCGKLRSAGNNNNTADTLLTYLQKSTLAEPHSLLFIDRFLTCHVLFQRFIITVLKYERTFLHFIGAKLSIVSCIILCGWIQGETTMFCDLNRIEVYDDEGNEWKRTWKNIIMNNIL